MRGLHVALQTRVRLQIKVKIEAVKTCRVSMGRKLRGVYVHSGNALVNHSPWAGIAGLVRDSIGGPIPGVVALAAYDDRQLGSVGFSLRTTFGAHSFECVEYFGKFFFEDSVELSLQRSSIMQASMWIKIAHLRHAVSEHVYSFREALADLLISLQPFDHHHSEIRDHLFTANVGI